MTATAPAATPHPFVPDFPGEPGYRPRCVTCGAERHPSPIPQPRKATR